MKQISFVLFAILLSLPLPSAAQEVIDAPLRIFTGHDSRVRSVAFSPNGTRILTGSDDHTAKLWDLTTGELLETFSGHEDRIYSVAFSPDGKEVLTGSGDGTARLWNTDTGNEIRVFRMSPCVSLEFPNAAGAVTFSPDGMNILTGTDCEGTVLWDKRKGERLKTFQGHVKTILSVAFSPDGTEFLAGDYGWTAELWDLSSGERILQYNHHGGPVYSVAFSEDGTRLLSIGAAGLVNVWNPIVDRARPERLREPALTIVESMPDGTSRWTGLSSAALSPDGTLILTANRHNGKAKLWDAVTGELISIYTQVGGYSVAFSPDGTQVLTDYSHGAALWDARVKPSGISGWERY